MSWLECPCKIIPALNCITEVLIERWNYMMPGTDFSSGDAFQFISAPQNHVGWKIDALRSSISQLYTHHFPVKNLGVWAGDWRPFNKMQGNSAEVKNAIAAELTSAGIDPAAFFLTNRPHPVSDGDFVRACYHLLNNVLLYSVYQPDYMKFQYHNLEWRDYDRNITSIDEISDSSRFGSAGDVVYGYYKQSLSYEISRKFCQYPFDSWGNQYSVELQGIWKARYVSEITKWLDYPRSSDVKPQYEQYNTADVQEVEFYGTEAIATNVLHPDIVRDMEYYKTWGNFKYDFAALIQEDVITEVFITKENFPEPNYKYLD